MDINEITIKEFFDKVTDMYAYNLVHYPEEKPTIDGAFKEVLLQYTEELYNEGYKIKNDALDMTIRIMDKLSEMKVLNKKQSADKDFAIQDAITQEIEIVFNRISLKDQIDNNSISIGEFHNEKWSSYKN